MSSFWEGSTSWALTKMHCSVCFGLNDSHLRTQRPYLHAPSFLKMQYVIEASLRNGASHPSVHQWDCYPGTLSLSFISLQLIWRSAIRRWNQQPWYWTKISRAQPQTGWCFIWSIYTYCVWYFTIVGLKELGYVHDNAGLFVWTCDSLLWWARFKNLP